MKVENLALKGYVHDVQTVVFIFLLKSSSSKEKNQNIEKYYYHHCPRNIRYNILPRPLKLILI